MEVKGAVLFTPAVMEPLIVENAWESSCPEYAGSSTSRIVDVCDISRGSLALSCKNHEAGRAPSLVVFWSNGMPRLTRCPRGAWAPSTLCG